MDIMTVTGPIGPHALGFTQPHEHVLVDLSLAKGRWDYEGTLVDVEIAIEEVRAYARSGGTSLVEMTTPDLGRDPNRACSSLERNWRADRHGNRLVSPALLSREIDRTSTSALAAMLVEGNSSVGWAKPVSVRV